MQRDWEYRATGHLHGLVADPDGNLFTVECVDAGTTDGGTPLAQCELVSFTETGTVRWRRPFSHPTPFVKNSWSELLLTARSRVAAAIGTGALDVFETGSGSLSWTESSGTADERSAFRVAGWLVTNEGELVSSIELRWRLDGGEVLVANVVGADLTAGAPGLRSHSRLSERGLPPSLVTSGRAFFVDLHEQRSSLADAPEFDTLIAFNTLPEDRRWTINWQSQQSFARDQLRQLRAAQGDQLLLTHPDATRILSARDGTQISSTLPLAVGEPPVVWDGNTLFMIPERCDAGPCSGRKLLAIDTATGTSQAVGLPEVRWLSDLWLTQKMTALVSFQPVADAGRLLEIDARGNPRMDCPLPFDSAETQLGTPLLREGQYAFLSGAAGRATTLRVWRLPGYSPAEKGWVSPRGGPGLDGRAR